MTTRAMETRRMAKREMKEENDNQGGNEGVRQEDDKDELMM